MGRDEALHLIPTYEVDGAAYPLPKILINDPIRQSYYRREVTLRDHERYLSERPASVVVTRGMRTDKWLSYRETIALPEGVSTEGRVVIRQYLQDCCHLTQLEVKDFGPVVEPDHIALPLPVVTASSVPFYRPLKEQVKERRDRLTVRIQFHWDKWDILPDYAGNRAELDRMDRVMKPLIHRRGDVQLLSTEIRGYASPEGKAAYNLSLSDRRAASLRDYIAHKYGTSPLGRLTAKGMGENWTELRDTLPSLLRLSQRQRVVDIIDHTTDLDARDAQIRAIDGGVTYSYIVDSIYPSLRCNIMELAYRVRPYTIEEADRLLDTRPQELSHEEIFLVAQRRLQSPTESKEYGREYETALHFFGDDPVALLNASSAALVRGEYDLAWSYLERVAEDPRSYNNLGLYYWAIDDREQALHFLELATEVPATISIATQNLRRLRDVIAEVSDR